MSLLSKDEIKDLVSAYGACVSKGRTIEQIISDGDIPELKSCQIYVGKVSSSVCGDILLTNEGVPVRLMYRSNRVSTHDINRGTIPFKDQVLAINHHVMLMLVKDVLGSSQFEIPGLTPTSTVIAAENLDPLMFEVILRLYMAESTTTTSLYQHWLSGEKYFCGHKIPTNMKPNGKLPYIMDTPSTKSKSDVSVSSEYLFDNKICTEEEYTLIRNNSILAFGIVLEHDRRKELLTVDTKLEYGKNKTGKILLMDEAFTLDSTRRWKLDPKSQAIELDENGKPKSYSKEFVRGMHFDHSTGLLNSEQEVEIAVRYIEAIQHLSGTRFEPDLRCRDERIIESTNLILKTLGIKK
jgi:phosphoribosylaminoimidazole-succinocarboxamide synthase